MKKPSKFDPELTAAQKLVLQLTVAQRNEILSDLVATILSVPPENRNKTQQHTMHEVRRALCGKTVAIASYTEWEESVFPVRLGFSRGCFNPD